MRTAAPPQKPTTQCSAAESPQFQHCLDQTGHLSLHNDGLCSHPKLRTPQFSALSGSCTCQDNNGHVDNPKELHLWNLTPSAQFCTVRTCLCEELEHHHTVDELKLRHLHVLDEDLLELVADDHRDVYASALPSICIPPWAGGKALHQSLCSAPPQHLYSHDCQDVRRVRRHFHQLFRQLRNPEQRTLRDGVHRSDRGHFDNLLVNNRQRDEEPDDFPPPVPASAAQEHREPVPHSQVRRAAPRCAAAPASCGLTSTRRSGRDPATGTSSTSMAKNWVPAAWGGGFARNVAVKCISLSSSPLLAIVCPRGAAWWFVSARSIATVSRSCRRNWRNRRSRRLLAVPAACSALGTDHMGSTDWRLRKRTRKTCLNLLLLLLFQTRAFSATCMSTTTWRCNDSH